jgi:aspartate/methionine/tyrosine aminotransferase
VSAAAPHAARLADVPFSPIREVLRRATALEAAGREVLHFELGRPDFDTPQTIKDAAVRALDAGQVHYSANLGLPELCRAIASKLARSNDLDYDPAGEILVTSGVSEAVLCAFAGLLDPGDQVIVPEPAWPHYAVCARLAGATPIGVATRLEADFAPNPAAIEAAITPRTRMLVVNSPNNPTGAVYAPALLAQLAAIAERHDLVVISDEIYEQLLWDGEHRSFAALPGMRERTVTLNGFSKAYSMTGWRIGYAAAPRRLLEPLLKLHQYNTVCVTTFAQLGAVEAYEGAEAARAAARMRGEFAARREILVAGLAGVPGLSLAIPAGAFYAFPRIELDIDAPTLCNVLLEEASVAVVPGDAFGRAGEGHLRISYATSRQALEAGLARIADTLGRLARDRVAHVEAP